MENKFISKILPIFIGSGYGVEKFDDTTYDIIDRSIIGKAKIGSILGRIGFGFGIGFTIFRAFYFIIIVGILGAI